MVIVIFYLKKKDNLTAKVKLYTTSKFISNDIPFEKKKKKDLTTKMRLYASGEVVCI